MPLNRAKCMAPCGLAVALVACSTLVGVILWPIVIARQLLSCYKLKTRFLYSTYVVTAQWPLGIHGGTG